MPKIKVKSSRGAKKRFKITGTGKVVHRKANKSHILTTKNRKRKNRLKKTSVANNTDGKNIKKLLPYS